MGQNEAKPTRHRPDIGVKRPNIRLQADDR